MIGINGNEKYEEIQIAQSIFIAKQFLRLDILPWKCLFSLGNRKSQAIHKQHQLKKNTHARICQVFLF